MPIKYALRSMRVTPLPETEQIKYLSLGYSPIELFYSYVEVLPAVAEADQENGVYAVHSYKGQKLSSWVPAAKDASYTATPKSKSSSPELLKDSICQELSMGDYAFTHDHTHKNLELVCVMKTMRTKVLIKSLNENWLAADKRTRSINPASLLKISPNLLGDEEPTVDEKYMKGFAVRTEAYEYPRGPYIAYVEVDEATAKDNPKGQFKYFNSQGDSVSDWMPFATAAYNQLEVSRTQSSEANSPSEDHPVSTDVMGTDIFLGDWVFSNDNRSHTFKLCQVMGITENKIRLNNFSQGERNITLNSPANIIKLPINIP